MISQPYNYQSFSDDYRLSSPPVFLSFAMAATHDRSTLGAQLLGNLAAAIFYGITCVQTYLYYNKGHNDRKLLKLLVFFLWLLDSVQLALVTHTSYYVMVSNFGIHSYPLSVWSLCAQMYLNYITQTIVRLVFIRRVWLLSDRNNYLAGGITIISVFAFATGIVYSAKSQTSHSSSYLVKITLAHIFCGSLAGDVLADILIATSLCFLLAQNRTGWKRTDSIVNILMFYAINTGLLTSIFATGCLVCHLIWPFGLIAISIYYSLGKLYFNSLLGMLNARESLREQMGGGISEIVLPDSHAEPHDHMPTGSWYTLRTKDER
ncbi:hypothetical protein L208DRAFT_1456479 [Tricholoma matsutake]|nr:hypothetical protein L208DRAFT_1456479 [Tricholoma matsutake 945]